MKTTNRNEVVNAWQVFFKDEPLVVMSFKPARIGVFTKKDALDNALKSKQIKTVYTTLNKVKKDSLQQLPINKMDPMKSGGGISAKDINKLSYFFVDIDVVGLQVGGSKRNATDESKMSYR